MSKVQAALEKLSEGQAADWSKVGGGGRRQAAGGARRLTTRGAAHAGRPRARAQLAGGWPPTSLNVRFTLARRTRPWT